MRSHNSIFPLPQGALSVHAKGDHNHVRRYKSYSWMETGLNRRERFSFGAMPTPNIADRTHKLANERKNDKINKCKISKCKINWYRTSANNRNEEWSNEEI